MSKINWKVRLANKSFWITMIPAILLLIQLVARLFGFEIKVDGLQENLLNIVNALFVVLAVLGITVDPTTKGIADSENALTYTEPK